MRTLQSPDALAPWRSKWDVRGRSRSAGDHTARVLDPRLPQQRPWTLASSRPRLRDQTGPLSSATTNPRLLVPATDQPSLGRAADSAGASRRQHVHARLPLRLTGRGQQVGGDLVAVAAHDLTPGAGSGGVGAVSHGAQDGRRSPPVRPLRQHGAGLLIREGDVGARPAAVLADPRRVLAAGYCLVAPPTLE